VSYSREDHRFVETLASDLRKSAFELWLDFEGLQPGTPDWESAVREAIEESFAFLLKASPDSRRSSYVRSELLLAQTRELPIYALWAGGESWIDSIPMETAVRELLVDKKLIGAGDIRRQIDVLDSRTPALGAKVIARAWVDPNFRRRLLANGRTACEEEFGISFYDDTELIVLENTDKVHNLIVCTLCSCYPRPVLGLPPDWYKAKPYRARAVREPRSVLAEFGTIIPDNVEIRVSDSTAVVRYLVLPMRPEDTENFSEEQLAALVTRDAMIGVVAVQIQAGSLS
jgi:nitrile hydratase alpha subunit